MNFRIFHLFPVCIVLLSIAASLPAAELYMWIDEKGVRNVSETPPDKPVQMIGKETGRRDSPEEIQRFQQQQKNYELDLEQRRKNNRAIEESNRRYDSARESQKDYMKQRDEERKARAVENAADLQNQKERRRAIENRDYDEARRLRIKNEQQRTDRAIDKSREIGNR